ncbi:hypothetical protein AV955_gp109 [Diadromus pulchellus ascovirus 4a]|uniref:Complete DpAV4 genome n=1 Tax=Diadromus pulchellus ascovirus 4a TaxID=158683 RepID=F2NZ38_9VIRU|nr:hypothetical protein AV955_gp109 [Diadromus pulchellus ascovirus 4a]CCA61466.1 unnamed protein product [Diadromus pulchellus ascovirus 4a]
MAWKLTNCIVIPLFHVVAIYSVYGCFAYSNSPLAMTAWAALIAHVAGFGVTAGVHRMWTHKAYKATAPFRVFLALCFSVAGQNTIPQWVLDHRVHHKYSDTTADPHNANRGFWFSHVGWLMMTKDPDVISAGRKMDMTDIYSDPVVVWHTKYFIPLKILLCFVIPVWVPVACWGETFAAAFLSQAVLRYALTLNFTWLVNSAAHMYGDRPFDKNIFPRENKLVAALALGEGWHNYHHVFPYDYKAAELGNDFNFTARILDFAASRGWVYDLRQPSRQLIEKIVENRGDGSK